MIFDWIFEDWQGRWDIFCGLTGFLSLFFGYMFYKCRKYF